MVNQMIRIPDGCVLWLDLTEDTGDILYDHSGNGNNGKVYGAVLEKRLPLIGRRFDGVDDYVRVHHSEEFNIKDEITVIGWIYPVALDQWHTVLHKASAYALQINRSNIPVFFVHVDGEWRSVLATRGIDKFKWYFLAGTYSKSSRTLQIFIDGLLNNTYVLSGLTTYDIDTSTADIYVGTRAAVADWTKGYIAITSIYNCALKQKEIKYLCEEFQKRVFRKIAPLEIRMR